MSAAPLIAITRPDPDGQSSAARYAALGFDTLVTPLLDFTPLSPGLPQGEGLAAIALTSANAIRALVENNALAPYLHLPAFCVGDRTANAARDAGISTIHIADGGLDDLIDLIAKSDLEGPLFYPGATHLSGDLAAALAPHNVLVIKAAIYDMQAATKLPEELHKALTSNTLAAVAFYSRRTAQLFAALAAPILEAPARHSFTALCLSENVAQPLLDAHFTRIALADYPSEEAMLSTARDILQALQS